jgi:hypothetical protein
MRFQTTKARHIDVWQNLPFSEPGRKSFVLIKNSTHGNLNTLFQGLFKIFAHDKNNIANNEEIQIKNIPETRKIETRSLKHLEDCANAARETEGSCQHEWINKSDG